MEGLRSKSSEPSRKVAAEHVHTLGHRSREGLASAGVKLLSGVCASVYVCVYIHIYIYIHTYIYIYTHIHRSLSLSLVQIHTDLHPLTHTHIYIYIHIHT